MIRIRSSPFGKPRAFHGIAPPDPESTYSKTPEYPPLPNHPGNQYLTQKEIVVSKMKSMDTVEEKAYYLNLPKYYGWYSLRVKEKIVRYGSLKFAQSVTATDIVSDELPVARSELTKKITSESLDLISHYIKTHRASTYPVHSVKGDDVEDRRDYNLSNKVEIPQFQFLTGLDRILSLLTQRASQTDYNSRLEAFWFKGGFDPDSRMIKKRRGNIKLRLKTKKLMGTLEDHVDKIYERYDRAISYVGNPLITKRSSSFSPHFLDMEDCRRDFQAFKEEEEFVHDPKSLGYSYEHVHGRNIPCVWTGSQNPCINLSYLSSLNKFKRKSTESCFSENVPGHMTLNDEALIKSLFHSFAATLSSSTYFGFTPFNNPTYPISTRTVVFDGTSMALSAYQLNRTELHQTEEHEAGRDLRNKMWFSPYRELYTLDSDGSLAHLNEDLIEDLVSIYLEKGEQRSEEEAYPFLHPEFKFIHQIKSAYNREYFWKAYLMMNNPAKDNLKRPGIEPWEKIHLIDNPTSMSILGLRDRPWFKMAKYDFRGREHWHPEFRKLDYYEPPYLPAKFRKERNAFKKNETRTPKVTIPVPKG